MKTIKVIYLVLITAAVLAACAGTGPTGMEWKSEAIQRGDLTTFVIANGAVRPNRAADLTWQMGGTVDKVLPAVGDAVRENDLLAALDPDSLPQTYYAARLELFDAQRALDALRQGGAEQSAVSYQDLLAAQKACEDAQKARDRLDRPRASSETIQSAEANYYLAQAAVDDAEGAFNRVSGALETDVARANALANLANAKKARDKALVNLNWYKGHAGDQEYTEADAALALAKARLDQAQLRYDRLKDGVPAEELEAARIRVEAAQAALRQAELAAPFSGLVTDVRVQPGMPVSVGMLAFRLEDRSHFFVNVSVAEMDVNRVRAGQPVLIAFDSIFGKQYAGRVVSVSLSGERDQGVVTYPVTVELDAKSADDSVRSGMSAVVKISVDTVKDALLVPNQAVRMLDNQRVVYILKAGSRMPQKMPIRIGLSSETMSEVLDGELQPGDQVVTNPDMLIQLEQGLN